MGRRKRQKKGLGFLRELTKRIELQKEKEHVSPGGVLRGSERMLGYKGREHRSVGSRDPSRKR